MTSGFDKLAAQAAAALMERMGYLGAGWSSDPGVGDSPIERLFYLALYARTTFLPDIFRGVRNGGSGTVIPQKLEDARALAKANSELIVQRQITLDGVGRVDFIVHAYGDWCLQPGGGVACWRTLVVECDGHDFHERTKEQAAKDRARDRHLLLEGYEVFRFTGSELWRDPWGCAGQVIAWAEKGA